MKIEYDPAKRETTLQTRRLDMAHAGDVWAGPHLSFKDDRRDYGEPRFVTFGLLGNRLVFVAWTLRGDARRIISMRNANDRERRKFTPLLGR